MSHIPKEMLEKSVIEILDIGSLPEEKQITLVENVLKLAQQRITIRMVESFTEEQKGDFLEYVSNEDHDAVAGLVADANIDMPTFVVEEVFKIKDEMLKHAEDITSGK